MRNIRVLIVMIAQRGLHTCGGAGLGARRGFFLVGPAVVRPASSVCRWPVRGGVRHLTVGTRGG